VAVGDKETIFFGWVLSVTVPFLAVTVVGNAAAAGVAAAGVFGADDLLDEQPAETTTSADAASEAAVIR
jgi:hypothetical protein